ncbi:hypothetical protein CASFOL_041179 [Castilleja foliolosa]|uniref:Protein farnesyltransferase/geranylgeranyltransferase type-1 subunit alpha n=1 Tax=Castilleja foliolosa TaxID=1961234 RepID=A0ABD3BDP3_9LAMI
MDSTWRERKSKVEELGSTEEALFDELKYTAKLLHKDSRNKYAWSSHRQWALEKLGRGYADELGFCNQMLKHNTHNRLIWDQKFFAVQKCLTKGMTIIRSCEVNVAMHAILDYPVTPRAFLPGLLANPLAHRAPGRQRAYHKPTQKFHGYIGAQ